VHLVGFIIGKFVTMHGHINVKEKFLCVEKKNQLDVTECFIALIIRSTCFGHFYAHHQAL